MGGGFIHSGGRASTQSWLRALACLALLSSRAGAIDLPTSPTSTTYAMVESLVMRRDDEAASQPLVSIEGSPDDALLATPDLRFPFGGGVRAFFGGREPESGGWEIGYLGLYDQSAGASTTTSGTTFLAATGPLGFDLTSAAQRATATWSSTITSVEANTFATVTSGTHRGSAWLTVDWLAGFRYIGVEESAAINVLSCGDAGPLVPYRVGTSNNLFGGQIGVRGRLDRARWAVEGWAKSGLLGNAQSLRQQAIIDWLGFEQRPAADVGGSGSGFVGDINLSVIYRLDERWGLRLGYNTIWIEGLALAPDQFTFGMNGPRTTIADGGGIFLHGLNLGLEARW